MAKSMENTWALDSKLVVGKSMVQDREFELELGNMAMNQVVPKDYSDVEAYVLDVYWNVDVLVSS